MSPLKSAWREYGDAFRAFSRPARLFLLCELLAWTGHGVFQVLFNLYLVEAGYQESFVGRAISLGGLGLALAALPAGLLADRWGRRRCLILGALLEGTALLVRATVLVPAVIYGSSFLAGAGQSLLAIAAAPFITENSTARERTHLFSTFFATALMAGVVGSLLGGWIPAALRSLPPPWRPELLISYRTALVAGALLTLVAAAPLLRLLGQPEPRIEHTRESSSPAVLRTLAPIALNSLLIGAGAGLVIPFMNLYFATRFQCSSAQIGAFFSIAQVFTAVASLLAPVVARRFGKLRTATASELLSLPFLITLGVENSLPIAVAAFWMRATLMQASSPLLQAFVMEALPPALRARSTSLNNLVWNGGWAVSATMAGVLIQRFGYAVPFYVTAVLYGSAAVFFYRSFRGKAETEFGAKIPEEAKGQRGEGPFTE